MVPAAGADALRLAVLTAAGLSVENLGDLVTASLSTDGEVALVERDQIQTVLRELELATALGAEAAGVRLKLGALLHADLLVFLNSEGDEDARFVSVVICDTKLGARLTQDRLDLADGPDALVAGITERITAARRRVAAGIERIIAVPPFVSRSLTHDLDRLQRQLPHVLEQAFTALPGAAVLEVDEVRAIQRELNLKGGGLQSRVVPWFVTGEYRQEGTLGQPGGTLGLKLALSDGQATQREVERSFASATELVTFLRSAAIGELISDGTGAAALSIQQQVANMEERARAFERQGKFDLSNDIREACLLFAPDDVGAVARLISAYAAQTGAWPRPSWYQQSAAEIRNAWTQRPARWRRGLELLEHLVRRRLATQQQAFQLLHALSFGMSNLITSGPSDPTQGFMVHDAELIALYDRELAECTQAARRFRAEPYYQIRELPTAPPTANQRSDQSAPDAGSEWYQGLFENPTYRRWRVSSEREPISPDRLARCAEIVTRVRSSAYGLSSAIVGLLEACAAAPRDERAALDASFQRLIATLERTGDPLDVIYARLGRLLWQHYSGAGEAAENARLDDEALALEQEFRRITGDAPQPLLRLRRALLGQTTTRRPEAPRVYEDQLKAATHVGDTGPAEYELRLERIDLRVRLPNGQEQPFGELTWAEQPGFVSEWCEPWGFERVGSVLDVIWSGCYVLAHREPGLLVPVLLDRGAEVRCVRADTANIWVASLRHGIQAYDLAGRLLNTIDTQTGLPPFDRTLIFTVFQPGKVVAAGAFGPSNRAWCAYVDTTAAPPKIDILLEATEAAPAVGAPAMPSDAPRSDDERRERELKRVFKPWRLDVYRDPYLGGRPLAVLERRTVNNKRMDPLLIDPEERTVRIVDAVQSYSSTSEYRPYFLPDSRILMPCQEHILLVRPLTRSRPPNTPQNVLYEDLRANHTSLVWADDGYLYAGTRRYWARIDPETLRVEPLGPRPALRPKASEGEFLANSAHFGLLSGTDAGKYFKVHVVPRSTPPELPRVRSIRAVDADTNAPLAHARAEFEFCGVVESTPVDAQGAVAIPPGLETSIATFRTEGYESRCVVLRDGRHTGAADGILTVPLRPHVRLKGKVVDPAGKPVRGMRVQVKSALISIALDDVLAQSETDEQGAWAAALLPDDVNQLWLVISSADSPGEKHEVELVAGELAQLRKGDHVVHLRTASTVANPGASRQIPPSPMGSPRGASRNTEVVVRGPTEMPLANVRITWLSQNSLGKYEERNAETDANGHCTLPEFHAGTLLFRASGFAEHVEARSQQHVRGTVREIQLTQALPTMVRVVDSDNNPIPSATVTAANKPDVVNPAGSLLSKAGTTGADGALAWDSVPTGNIDWTVVLNGKKLVVTQAAAGLAGEFVVQVRPAKTLHITGSVTGLESGAPLPEFRVVLAPTRRSSRSARDKGRPFAAGRYDLFVDEPAPEYELGILAAGYLPQRLSFKVEDRAEISQDFKLRAGDGLTLMVLRPDGTPAAGMSVLSTDHALGSREYPFRTSWVNDELHVTDEQGMVTLEPRLGKRWIVVGDTDDVGLVTADESTSELVSTLRPWCSVTGTWEYVPDGLESELVLRPLLDESEGIGIDQSQKISLGPDGAFEFRKVLPGEFELFRQIQVRRSATSASLHQVRQTRLKLEPGQQLRLVVKATGRAVAGRLVRADGSAVVDAEVRGLLGFEPGTHRPPNEREMTREERRAWEKANPSQFNLFFDRQGRFVGVDVPPNEYIMSITGTAPGSEGPVEFRLSRRVLIPPAAQDEALARVELGEFNIDETQREPATSTTSPAPATSVQDDDGRGRIALRAGIAVVLIAAASLAVRRCSLRRSRDPARSLSVPMILLGITMFAGARGAHGQKRSDPDTAPLLPTVHAIEAFKQDCGLWPQRLDDLVPRFISAAPAGCTYEWSWEGYVRVTCRSGTEQLVFVFNGDDRGWYAGRPGSFRMLAEPPPAPPTAPRPRLEVLKAATAEFDRRIARDPNDSDQRRAKLAYLYAADALAEAEQAALDWIAAVPRDAAPRYALADIARKKRTGLEGRWQRTDAQSDILEGWALRARDSYGLWRAFIQPGSSSVGQERLPHMIEGSLAKDRTEWLFAELYLNEDADLWASHRKANELLTLCERWEATAAQFSDPPPDQGFHVYRTVAYVLRNEHEKASAEFALAIAAHKAGRTWADPRELEPAVRGGAKLPERLFLFEQSETDWPMKLNCPPPER